MLANLVPAAVSKESSAEELHSVDDKAGQENTDVLKYVSSGEIKFDGERFSGRIVSEDNTETLLSGFRYGKHEYNNNFLQHAYVRDKHEYS